jgi:hypothetical protein
MASSTYQFNFSQLEQLWIQNGGASNMAPTMAAIALAESGGNALSNNYTDNGGKQTSWGLWQISNGTHNMPVANMNDPNVNAQQAVAKFKSQGITAWGTYDSGAYKKYLAGGVTPTATGVPGVGTTPTGITGVSPTGCSSTGGINLDAASSIPVVGSILPSVTIGNQCQMKALTGGLMVGGGFIILVLGALMIAGKSASGTRAGKAAVGYVTGGPAGALAGASTGAQPVVGRTTRTGSQSDEAAQAADERKADRATARLAKQQETDARVAESVRQGREARAHSGRRVPASSSGSAF